MRTTALLLSAAALTSTAFAASSDVCEAQNIVDACVSGYSKRISDCEANSNDWICLCDVYKDKLTCYNNCPDSNERPPVQNQVTQFCAAAEPLRAASSASLASAASVAKTASTATTATPTSSSASATGSGTATATSSTSAFATGAAGPALSMPAGAAIVAVLAAVGLF